MLLQLNLEQVRFPLLSGSRLEVELGPLVSWRMHLVQEQERVWFPFLSGSRLDVELEL